MSKFIYFVSIFLLFNSFSTAQEMTNSFDFGSDVFQSGSTVVFKSKGADDIFMVGESIRSEEAITGTAHLLGRKISISGNIGGDAYAAGMDVSLDASITGDATLTGYNLDVGEVNGDLRVSGANIVISGPVSGYALIAGDEVKFESVISGNVNIAASEITFTDGARIDGKLTLYEEKPGEIEVPSYVISEERIERKDASKWSDVASDITIWDWRSALWQFVVGVITISAITALIAIMAPKKLANLRRDILDRPFTNLLLGFLAQSAIIGSIILLMLTLIGFLIAPAALLLALISGFAGYIVAAYAFGVGLLLAFGKSEPSSIGTRAFAAVVGALSVAIIGLIPFFGWLFVLALVLSGIGAITVWIFRPKSFVA